MRSIAGKFLTMRKAQLFVVYPRKAGDFRVIVQSAKAIGAFDARSGKGRLYYNAKQGAYAPGFAMLAFGVDFTFPPEFVKAATGAGAVTEGSSDSFTAFL